MATVTQPGVPVRELGYVNPFQSNFYQTNYDADEITAALIWPNNLRIYDQMCREDTQITSILRAVMLPVRRARYRIDPAGARPEVVQLVAEDLGLPISGQGPAATPGRRRRKKFSWNDHLRQALLELRYGHMFFEQTYDVSSGQARLAKLSPRMPRTLYQIKVAPDGSLISIDQLAPLSGKSMTVTIPAVKQAGDIQVSQLVPYIHEMEGANWLGTSLLRPAYKHWLIKDRLLRVQAQAIDRNGMGIPVYTGSEEAAGADMDRGLEIATSIRSGDNSGTAIPNGSALKLMGVEGRVPSAMEPINYHDQAVARGVLANFLTLGGATGNSPGSYNLGTQFVDFFAMSLQTVADSICDVVTSHVIECLVDLNWGPDEPAPQLVCDEIGAENEATGQALLMLYQAGVLKPDEPLVQYIRQRYNLPAPDPSTAIAATPPGQQPTQEVSS